MRFKIDVSAALSSASSDLLLHLEMGRPVTTEWTSPASLYDVALRGSIQHPSFKISYSTP
jgi:hypothetical protein